MNKDKQINKNIILFFFGVLSLFLTGCSDDNNDERMRNPNSLICLFVEPKRAYYSQDDFQHETLYTEDRKEITGFRILSFNIIACGNTFNPTLDNAKYIELLNTYGDTACTINKIPVEAWDYRPLSKSITKIAIVPYKDIVPDLKKGEDCSRYFEISYVSWIDYIRNGYSWKGLDTTGPVYKMSISEFNSSGPKELVDANKLRFHLLPQLSDHYTSFIGDTWMGDLIFIPTIYFSDGTSISYEVVIVDGQHEIDLLNFENNYNVKWPKW